MLTIDYRSYCQVYVLLFGLLFCHSLPFTSLPVSTWFSFGSIGFWIWPRYIVTRTHRLYHMCICGIYAYVYIHIYVCVCVCVCVCIYIYIYVYVCVCAVIPHTALLSHLKLPQGKFLHRDSPIVGYKLFTCQPPACGRSSSPPCLYLFPCQGSDPGGTLQPHWLHSTQELKKERGHLHFMKKMIGVHCALEAHLCSQSSLQSSPLESPCSPMTQPWQLDGWMPSFSPIR